MSHTIRRQTHIMESYDDPAIQEKETHATQWPNDQGRMVIAHVEEARQLGHRMEEMTVRLSRLVTIVESLSSRYNGLETRIVREIQEGPHNMIQGLQNELVTLKRKHKIFVESKIREHSNLLKSVYKSGKKLEEAELVASRRKTLIKGFEQRLEESERREKETQESLDALRKWQSKHIRRTATLSGKLSSAGRSADIGAAAVYILLFIIVLLCASR